MACQSQAYEFAGWSAECACMLRARRNMLTVLIHTTKRWFMIDMCGYILHQKTCLYTICVPSMLIMCWIMSSAHVAGHIIQHMVDEKPLRYPLSGCFINGFGMYTQNTACYVWMWPWSFVLAVSAQPG